jgi:methylthioribose-1-phosphate isomerase
MASVNVKESPLFVPTLWEGDRFVVLDETQIPLRTEYITVTEPAHAIEAVKDMKTRAFGQVLTFIYTAALAVQSRRIETVQEARERIQALAQEFKEARPTFDFEGIAALLLNKLQGEPAHGETTESLVHGILDYGAGVVAARNARAKRVSELLPRASRLLTHCNVSGELVAVAQHCQELGKEVEFIATETRPYLQGSRLTAWELSEAGVKVSLIPDSAIAQVMERKQVDAAIVGSDRCARNGDIVNKVGTYPIALMAQQYGVPFYALVQHPGKLRTGSDLSIEERPSSELLEFHGRSVGPEGAGGRYPAFDVTPASLISRLIGFEGVFSPDEFRQKYGGETSLETCRHSADGGYVMTYGVPKGRNYCSYLAEILREDKATAILVPEMRPELWGARLVARRLVQDRLPVTLIADDMMGTFFAQGKITRLLLFYSEVTEPGIRSACGSLLAARLARAHGVRIQLNPAEQVNERPEDPDVTTFLGQRVAPAGVEALRVKDEVMPWDLLRAY